MQKQPNKVLRVLGVIHWIVALLAMVLSPFIAFIYGAATKDSLISILAYTAVPVFLVATQGYLLTGESRRTLHLNIISIIYFLVLLISLPSLAIVPSIYLCIFFMTLGCVLATKIKGQ